MSLLLLLSQCGPFIFCYGGGVHLIFKFLSPEGNDPYEAVDFVCPWSRKWVLLLLSWILLEERFLYGGGTHSELELEYWSVFFSGMKSYLEHISDVCSWASFISCMRCSWQYRLTVFYLKLWGPDESQKLEIVDMDSTWIMCNNFSRSVAICTFAKKHINSHCQWSKKMYK